MTVESITQTSASVSVAITNANGRPVYLQYRKASDTGWTDVPAQTAASGDSSVSFSLTSLTQDTTYNVRASLSTPVTDSTTNVTKDFDTLGPPSLSAASAGSVTSSSAIIAVGITNANNTSVYLQYKENSETDWIDTTSQSAVGDTSVSFSLTGLEAGADYQVRASLTDPITDGTTNVTESFTTLTVPVLGSATVESKRHNSAIVKVAISNPNNTSVYLQYKKTSETDWTDATSQSAAQGDTSVSFSLTGLDAGTDYQVRSSLTDPITDGTTNVTESFTTLTVPVLGSATVEDTTQNSAIVKVAISNPNNTSVYLQYKKSTDVIWTDATSQTAASGDSSVSFSLTSLTQSTKYNVRASLETPITASTTNVTKDFDTLGPPSLGAASAGSVTSSSAIIAVGITNASNTPVHLQYKKASDTGWTGATSQSAALGDTSVSFSLTGLEAGADYQVRASLTDPITDGTTNVTESFTTLATPAALGAVTVDSITQTSASVSVAITNANGTPVYLQYKKSTDVIWTDATSQTAASGDSSVSFSLTSLTRDTTYNLRASLETPVHRQHDERDQGLRHAGTAQPGHGERRQRHQQFRHHSGRHNQRQRHARPSAVQEGERYRVDRRDIAECGAGGHQREFQPDGA